MKLKMLVPLVIIFSVLALVPSMSLAQTSPQPPKDLLASVENDNSVTLTWTPPFDTTVIGFNIYRKEDISGAQLTRINSGLSTNTVYIDKGVKKGKSYSYICRSVNADGTESEDSNLSGAPKMQMAASATVTHMGRPVRIASPGDVIKYNIDFANQGFGVAKNVVIVYAIPKGTTFITGTASCPKYKVKIAYYDENEKTWVDKVANEETISKVRFTVLEDVYPLAKEKNDTASLKVLVNY